MKFKEKYTAQELREMSEHLVADISDTENECNEYRNAAGSFDLSDCELALCQAAELRERCEEKLHSMKFGHCSPEIEDVKDFIEEILNYILHGATEK